MTARSGERGEQVAAIVPAAGRGERLGPGAPKALRLLGGVPLLVHAVRAGGGPSVDLVVVAAPPDDVSPYARCSTTTVPRAGGGRRRHPQESVGSRWSLCPRTSTWCSCTTRPARSSRSSWSTRWPAPSGPAPTRSCRRSRGRHRQAGRPGGRRGWPRSTARRCVPSRPRRVSAGARSKRAHVAADGARRHR